MIMLHSHHGVQAFEEVLEQRRDDGYSFSLGRIKVLSNNLQTQGNNNHKESASRSIHFSFFGVSGNG